MYNFKEMVGHWPKPFNKLQFISPVEMHHHQNRNNTGTFSPIKCSPFSKPDTFLSSFPFLPGLVAAPPHPSSPCNNTTKSPATPSYLPQNFFRLLGQCQSQRLEEMRLQRVPSRKLGPQETHPHHNFHPLKLVANLEGSTKSSCPPPPETGESRLSGTCWRVEINTISITPIGLDFHGSGHPQFLGNIAPNTAPRGVVRHVLGAMLTWQRRCIMCGIKRWQRHRWKFLKNSVSKNLANFFKLTEIVEYNLRLLSISRRSTFLLYCFLYCTILREL